MLLVRERDDGGWTDPGGWADVGEAPSTMAVREVKEESGFDVVVRKLVAIYDRNQHPLPPSPQRAYKIMFLCDLTGGEARLSYETPEVAFFPRHALPPLSAARISAFQIDQVFEHAAHPELPALFD